MNEKIKYELTVISPPVGGKFRGTLKDNHEESG